MIRLKPTPFDLSLFYIRYHLTPGTGQARHRVFLGIRDLPMRLAISRDEWVRMWEKLILTLPP